MKHLLISAIALTFVVSGCANKEVKTDTETAATADSKTCCGQKDCACDHHDKVGKCPECQKAGKECEACKKHHAGCEACGDKHDKKSHDKKHGKKKHK